MTESLLLLIFILKKIINLLYLYLHDYLRQNNIDSNLPGITTLLQEMTDYVKNGNEKDIIIPLPEMKKNIKCYLPLKRCNKCEVVLKHIQ